MQNGKATVSPTGINDKLEDDGSADRVEARKYRSLSGRLIYLTYARPDISYSVGLLSRFMNNPTKHHFGGAKRVLRYLARTVGYGIWYTHFIACKLESYTDSDWGGSLIDRRNSSRMAYNLESRAIT